MNINAILIDDEPKALAILKNKIEEMDEKSSEVP